MQRRHGPLRGWHDDTTRRRHDDLSWCGLVAYQPVATNKRHLPADLAAQERLATADLLRGLIEVDARRLYLREGCSSLSPTARRLQPYRSRPCPPSSRVSLPAARMPRMETLRPYLIAGAVIGVLIAWSWYFQSWSNSRTARRSRSPLWLGFSATAASALFLMAGVTGFNLSRHSQFSTGSAWTDGVIWWEVVVGLVLASAAIYLVRRGVREIAGRLGHI
jgi:hypothetical protein